MHGIPEVCLIKIQHGILGTFSSLVTLTQLLLNACNHLFEHKESLHSCNSPNIIHTMALYMPSVYKAYVFQHAALVSVADSWFDRSGTLPLAC